MERLSSEPSRALLSHFPSGDKNPLWIYPPKGRAERSQWGSLDSLSILFVSMNHVWIFKKMDYQTKIETSIFASQPHIKMERLSSGPSRALFSQSPFQGTKHFQVFKKADNRHWNERSNIRFLHQLNGKSINWTHWELLAQHPLGGYNIFKILKRWISYRKLKVSNILPR